MSSPSRYSAERRSRTLLGLFVHAVPGYYHILVVKEDEAASAALLEALPDELLVPVAMER